MNYTFYINNADGNVIYQEDFDLTDYFDRKIIENADKEALDKMLDDVCYDLRQEVISSFYFDCEKQNSQWT